MTTLAQGLPVRTVPERILITLVRYDVIDYHGWLDNIVRGAMNTEWMFV